jgi:hypothetical protein
MFHLVYVVLPTRSTTLAPFGQTDRGNCPVFWTRYHVLSLLTLAGDVMRWHDAGGGAVGEGAELSIDLGLLSRLLLERRDYDPDL